MNLSYQDLLADKDTSDPHISISNQTSFCTKSLPPSRNWL